MRVEFAKSEFAIKVIPSLSMLLSEKNKRLLMSKKYDKQSRSSVLSVEFVNSACAMVFAASFILFPLKCKHPSVSHKFNESEIPRRASVVRVEL